MRDVALSAGVSAKTVSNVVNGYRHVSPATRARVQRALDDLGYEMNLAARHLRSGRTGIIALALPELGQPYFAELAEEVVRYAEACGLTVLIEQTGPTDVDRERQVLVGTRKHLVDGLLFSSLALEPEELGAANPDFPVVLLGENVRMGTLDHVSIDNVPAARAATEHLVALGHRRIAALGLVPKQRMGTATLRLQGFTEVLQEAGLPAGDVVVAAPWHRDAGAAAAEAVLRRRKPLPEAIFCLNDALALGALSALLRAGVRVPDDIALIGFDDIEASRFAFPSLSTVAPGRAEIARRSIDLLRHRMSVGFADRDGPREVFVGYELIARESTLGHAPLAPPTARTTRPAQTGATPVRSTSRDRYVSPGLSTVDG